FLPIVNEVAGVVMRQDLRTFLFKTGEDGIDPVTLIGKRPRTSSAISNLSFQRRGSTPCHSRFVVPIGLAPKLYANCYCRPGSTDITPWGNPDPPVHCFCPKMKSSYAF